MQQPPWATGPSEILKHGLSLLDEDNDSYRRLAMLSIDNAVELTIKTFLSLPRRITSINLSRREYQEISESFPQLLDALEKHAANRLEGIDLGEIEWFHRLRNELYHQGNGLTVEREKVEIYAELAQLLFKNLFNYDVDVFEGEKDSALLRNFLSAWADLERATFEITAKNPLMFKKQRETISIVRELVDNMLLKDEISYRIDELEAIRSRVIFGIGDYDTIITPRIVSEIKTITTQLKNLPIPEPINTPVEENRNSEDNIPF